MSDVYNRMVKLLAANFGLEEHEIHPEDTFEGLEVDSLALVELSLAAQDEFGVPISDDDLGRENTVTQAVEMIEAKVVMTDVA
jgi:acyl carrier protein